jgi:hypothetical protein
MSEIGFCMAATTTQLAFPGILGLQSLIRLDPHQSLVWS